MAPIRPLGAIRQALRGIAGSCRGRGVAGGLLGKATAFGAAASLTCIGLFLGNELTCVSFPLINLK